MSIDEQQLRQHLRTAPIAGAVDTAAAIAAGHRQLRVRRRRRAVSAVVPAVLAAVAGGWVFADAGSGYELVGSGLTLAAGSQGPVQVEDDRVDMGNGLQAWREGDVVAVGYAAGAHAWLDTDEWTYRFRPQGQFDVATFDAEGASSSATAVVGAMRGEPPEHVEASIGEASSTATVACFTQAKGWCVYATVVPVAVTDDSMGPAAEVEVQF